jgi:hypothetical protein
MARHAMDEGVERMARRQHGAFSVAQARAEGATRSMIATRRTSGQWTQLAPTVFALPGNPPTWHRQVMAAQLSTPRSSIAGLAAGHLLELEGFRAVRPELRVPRGAGHRTALATVHQTDRFLARAVGPFSAATVEQALCDSAARLGPRLGDVVTAAITGGRTSAEAIAARCHALWPQPPKGVPRLLGIAMEHGELPGVPMSVLEAELFRILLDPRIPAWEPQATPPWWPRSEERLDVFIPSWSLIVEGDGRRWHTRARDFDRDRRRDHTALVHGCRVVRFTHGQVVHEPDYVLGVLLAAGAAFRRLRPAA